MQLWFYSIHLFTSTRHGVSAKELQRQLGVTYKTAWRIAGLFRQHMADVDGETPIGGPGTHVEIDETLIGGVKKGTHNRGSAAKTVLIGATVPGGQVVTAVVPNQRRVALQPFVETNVQIGGVVRILSDETDPSKLHDLKATLDGCQVYGQDDIDKLVGPYLSGADRDKLDPILDGCVAAYLHTLDENWQVAFKGSAKAFARKYAFLSSALPFSSPEWEKLSIFLNFLIPKLPAPRDEDLSKGILEAIDMDSYRVEKQSAQRLFLADEDSEIEPVPLEGGGHKPEPELEWLSAIIHSFKDLFGNIDWADSDRIRKLITEEIPQRVAANEAYQNAQRNSDKPNARIELDKALRTVIVGLMKDDTQLFKQFSDDADFRRWLSDSVFNATYRKPNSPPNPTCSVRCSPASILGRSDIHGTWLQRISWDGPVNH